MSDARRPNFLYIVTDQQRADHLGCYGNPIVRTPHIDALAARGSRFDRFYVAHPVCMPNRATLMTGRMPSLHKVRFNGIPLDREATTFVDVLRADGYRTALVGKSHLQNFMGMAPERHYAAREGLRSPAAGLRDASKRAMDGPNYEHENTLKWIEDPGRGVPTPFYGFDHVRLCTRHADNVQGHYRAWLAERHPDPDSLRGPKNAIPDARYSAPFAWRTRIPEELYPTSYVAEETIAYLEDHARDEGDAPFFLQCSFPDPHAPFTPPGHYWDMYDPDEMPLPPTFGKGDTMPIRQLRDWVARQTGQQTANIPYMTDARATRECIALTYGMVTMIDDAVGRILGALSATGLDRDTVVIFNSDHGDWMGDHGLMLKGALHYQGLIRVPFIVRDPAVDEQASSVGDVCGSLDFARTILARAGIDAPNGMQGADLGPLWRGQAGLDRPGVLIEHDTHRAHLGFDTPLRVRSFVTERYRASVFQPIGHGELYDLKDDPHELVDLWDAPEHAGTRHALCETWMDQLISHQDEAPLPTYIA